jgi:hypothetical protein
MAPTKIKGLRVIILLLAISVIFVVVGKQKNKVVCCESYGLGSHMIKVNIKHEWVLAADCSAPIDFVGRGKEVVADSYCMKICEEDSDCIIMGKDGDCNAGCYNVNYRGWISSGKCYTAAPDVCFCSANECQGSHKL